MSDAPQTVNTRDTTKGDRIQQNISGIRTHCVVVIAKGKRVGGCDWKWRVMNTVEQLCM